jgi:hypothetical protein
MHGDEARTAVESCATTVAGDGKGLPGKRQDCSCTQGHHYFRVDEFEFLIQPPMVVFHFTGRWPLMDAALSALLEFEVLDGIGDVNVGPIRARLRLLRDREAGRRGQERPALPVFLIARLFANKRHWNSDGPLAQHCARRP